MTHELKKIIRAYLLAQKKGMDTVLATVVALEGSSYRRPGVRMLIRADGKMIGAVSGGCVEKEVRRQAENVFKDRTAKMMTYDGRYRLGCEGILYILIEPINPSKLFLKAFDQVLEKRQKINVSSYFSKEEGKSMEFGSIFKFDEENFPINAPFKPNDTLAVFKQELKPCFKLMIIGAEHDAVQLCSYAAMTGWEVEIVASAAEQKTIQDFPGALHFRSVEPENLETALIDIHTAVVLMTHSYVRDLKHLLAIKDTKPAYLGLLGPSKRREKLLAEVMERHPDISEEFFDSIHGPAGLNIGAETAQEISLAILTEILSITRSQEPMMLKDKKGGIHN